MIRFVDETGLNPLAPGIFVALTTTDPATGNAVSAGSGYLQLGGVLPIGVAGAIRYTATFWGSLAAGAPPTSFYGIALPGADTTVTVLGYVSPTLSPAGYAAQEAKLEVRGYVGQNAPNAAAVSQGVTASLAALDAQTMGVLAGERLPSAQGAQIDSWAADFLGSYLPRYLYEPDALYVQRIYAAFGPRCTLAAIEQAVRAFYLATQKQRARQLQPNLAFDVQGGYDERGGFDVYVNPPQPSALIPVVSVWDAQSNPALAAQYAITPPSFVISLGFSGLALAWYLDRTYVDLDAYLISIGTPQLGTAAPDARLASLINLFKSAGTQPLYLVNQS